MSTQDDRPTESTESTESTERLEGTEPTTRLEEPTPEAELETRAGGRHPVQIGYLVAGLLALGMALVWLLSETGVIDGPANDGVGVSMVLITAGLAGLLASVGRTARRRP